MAKPSPTLPRLCLALAAFALGAWGILTLYDRAPGGEGVRPAKVPGEAVYAGGRRVRATWGDVFVRVLPHDSDPPAFTLELYSGSSGELLGRCELQAERTMPPRLDPRRLAPAGPDTMTYAADDGTEVPLRRIAGPSPFLDPR